jgi:hypothetical protein
MHPEGPLGSFRAIDRRDFLRLGGAGIASAAYSQVVDSADSSRFYVNSASHWYTSSWNSQRTARTTSIIGRAPATITLGTRSTCPPLATMQSTPVGGGPRLQLQCSILDLDHKRLG